MMRSTDLGKTWKEAAKPPAFPKAREGQRARAVHHNFWITPGHASEPGTWYVAVRATGNSEAVKTQTYTINISGGHAGLTWTGYAMCSGCHNSQAQAMYQSVHYQWKGSAAEMTTGPAVQGKMDAIDGSSFYRGTASGAGTAGMVASAALQVGRRSAVTAVAVNTTESTPPGPLWLSVTSQCWVERLVRTGRASASIVEPIQVEAYGQMTPINQLGTVNVPEPRMVVINVWDKAMVGKVEKAIRESGIGINPVTDGPLIRLPIPELNEERRRELTKVASHYAEQARVAIRNVRRDGMDQIKKAKAAGMSEDDQKMWSDEVQEMTDKTIASVDKALESKQAEIMQV